MAEEKSTTLYKPSGVKVKVNSNSLEFALSLGWTKKNPKAKEKETPEQKEAREAEEKKQKEEDED